MTFGDEPVPLRRVATALRATTTALAAEVASPGTPVPKWSALEWRVARCAAAIHGVSPWLALHSPWRGPDEWHAFLHAQHQQCQMRERRTRRVLQALEARARADVQRVVALKGAALLPLSLYEPGARPMADIDLLVRPSQVEWLHDALGALGYRRDGGTERHDVYEPVGEAWPAVLGESGDAPVRIEVHQRVAERLPDTSVDITGSLWPIAPEAGVLPYPSRVELFRHLLLHAAGNMAKRWLRLLQLMDLARLCASFTGDDWRQLLEYAGGADRCWWMYAPLRLMHRTLGVAPPPWFMDLLHAQCPASLAWQVERRPLAGFSGSHLWVGALPALAWSRSPLEVARYVLHRLRPDRQAAQYQAHYVRRQTWGGEGGWYTGSQSARLLRWLVSRPPRPQVLQAVRQSLAG